MKKFAYTFLFISISVLLLAENGHNLWLHNSEPKPVHIVCSGSTATLNTAKQELQQGWQGQAGAAVFSNCLHQYQLN